MLNMNKPSFPLFSRRRPTLQPVHVAAPDQDIIADEASDYYSLLGLGHTATSSQIKRAYRKYMKEYHPDQSNDEDNHEFAVFLNHVYETLMDPDFRAEYDAILGFAVGGVNPFKDRSHPADLVFVDEFACIGCRNCNNVCPKTFGMEDEFGRARVMTQGVDIDDKLQEAMDTCPVSCIHWVSAPQLTLLEETMARMERVATWLLMSSGGRAANLNVFFEASIAWEKRKQELIQREQVAKSKYGMWNNFGPAAGSKMNQKSDVETSTDEEEPVFRRTGKVDAKTIAAAARKWRDFARKKRQREQRYLGSGDA